MNGRWFLKRNFRPSARVSGAIAGFLLNATCSFQAVSSNWCCSPIFERIVNVRNECLLLKDAFGKFATLETFDKLSLSKGLDAVQAVNTFLASLAGFDEAPAVIDTQTCQSETLDFRLDQVAAQLTTLNTALLTSLGLSRTDFETNVNDLETLRSKKCQGLCEARQEINGAIESLNANLTLWMENVPQATYIYDRGFYEGTKEILTALEGINDGLQGFPLLEDLCSSCAPESAVQPNRSQISETLLVDLQDTATLFSQIVPFLEKTACPFCSAYCPGLRINLQNLHRLNQALQHAADGFDVYQSTKNTETETILINDLEQGTTALRTITTLLEDITPNTAFACPFRDRKAQFEALENPLATLTETVVHLAETINPNPFTPTSLPITGSLAEDSCQGLEALLTACQMEIRMMIGETPSGASGLKALSVALTKAPFMTSDVVDTAMFDLFSAAQTLTPARFTELAKAFAGGDSHGIWQGMDTLQEASLSLVGILSDACSYATFWRKFTNDLAELDESLKTIAANFQAFAGVFQTAADETSLSADQSTVLQAIRELWTPIEDADAPGTFLPSLTENIAPLVKEMTRFFLTPPSTNLRELRHAFLAQTTAMKTALARMAQSVDSKREGIGLTLSAQTSSAPSSPPMGLIKESFQATTEAYTQIVNAFKHLGYDDPRAESFVSLSRDLKNLAESLNGTVVEAGLVATLQGNATKLGNNPPLPYAELSDMATALASVPDEHGVVCHGKLLAPMQGVALELQRLKVVLEHFASKEDLFVDTLEETLWKPAADALNKCLTGIGTLVLGTSPCPEEGAVTYLGAVTNQLKTLETSLVSLLPNNPLEGFEASDGPTDNNCASLATYRTDIAETLEGINGLFPVWLEHFNASAYTYNNNLQNKVQTIVQNLSDLREKPFPVLESFCSLCESASDANAWQEQLQTLQANFGNMSDSLKQYLCCPPLCAPIYESTQHVNRIKQSFDEIAKNLEQDLTPDAKVVIAQAIDEAATALREDVIAAFDQLVPTSTICSVKKLEGVFATINTHLKKLADAAYTVAKTLNPRALIAESSTYTGDLSCTALTDLWTSAKDKLGELTAPIRSLDAAFADCQFVVDEPVEQALQKLITAFNLFLGPPEGQDKRRFPGLVALFANSSGCDHDAFVGFEENLAIVQTYAEDLVFKIGVFTNINALDRDTGILASCLEDFGERFQVLSNEQAVTIADKLGNIDVTALAKSVQAIAEVFPVPNDAETLRRARECFTTRVHLMKETVAEMADAAQEFQTLIFGAPVETNLDPSPSPSLTSIQTRVEKASEAYAVFMEKFKHLGYKDAIGLKLIGVKNALDTLVEGLGLLTPLLGENPNALSPTLSLPYAELGPIADLLDQTPDRHAIRCHALLFMPLKQIRLSCAKLEAYLRFLASTSELFTEAQDPNWLATAQALKNFLVAFNTFPASKETCAFERFAADLTTISDKLNDLTLELEFAFPSQVFTFTDPHATEVPSLNCCASMRWFRGQIAQSIDAINALFPVWTEHFTPSHYTYHAELQRTVEGIASELAVMITNVSNPDAFPSLESLCSLCTEVEEAAAWKTNLSSTQAGFTEMARLLQTSLCCGFLCPSLEESVHQLRRLNAALPRVCTGFGRYLPSQEPTLVARIQDEISALTDLQKGLNTLQPSKSSSVCPFKDREADFEALGVILKRLVDAVVDTVSEPFSDPEREAYAGAPCDVFETLCGQMAEQLRQIEPSLTALDQALTQTDVLYDPTLEATLSTLKETLNNFSNGVNFDALTTAFSPEKRSCHHACAFSGFWAPLVALPSCIEAIQTTLSGRCCTRAVRILHTVGQALERLTAGLTTLNTHYQDTMLEFETDEAFSEWSAPADAILPPLEHLPTILSDPVNFPKPLHATADDWFEVAGNLESYKGNMDALLEGFGLERTDPLGAEGRAFLNAEAPDVLENALKQYALFAAALETFASTLEQTPPLHANIPVLLNVLPTLSQTFAQLASRLSDQAHMDWLCFEAGEEIDLTSVADAAVQVAPIAQQAFIRIEAVLSAPGCCLVFAQELFQVIREAQVIGALVQQVADLGEVKVASGNVASAEMSLGAWGQGFEKLTQSLNAWKQSLDDQIALAQKTTPTPYCLYKETSLSDVYACASEVATEARSFLAFLGIPELDDEPPLQQVNKATGCANVAVGVQQLIDTFTALKGALDTILTNFLKATDRFYYPTFLAAFRLFGERFETFCQALARIASSESLGAIPLDEVCVSCASSTVRRAALEALKQATEALPSVVKGPGSLGEAWEFYDDSTLNKRLTSLLRDACEIKAVLEGLSADENSAQLLNTSYHNAVEPSLTKIKHAYAEELRAVQRLRAFLSEQGREALILDQSYLDEVVAAFSVLKEKMRALAAFIDIPPAVASSRTFDTYYHNTDAILQELSVAFSGMNSAIQKPLQRMEAGAPYNTPREVVTLLDDLSRFEWDAALQGFPQLINHRLNLVPSFESLTTTAADLRTLLHGLSEQFKQPTYFNAVEAAANAMGAQARILVEGLKHLTEQAEALSQEALLTQLALVLEVVLPKIVSPLEHSPTILKMSFPQDQTSVDAVTADLNALSEDGFAALVGLVEPLLDGHPLPEVVSPTTMTESWAAVSELFTTLESFLLRRVTLLPEDFAYQNEPFLQVLNLSRTLEKLPSVFKAWWEAATNPACVFASNVSEEDLISVAQAAAKSADAAQRLVDGWQAHCCDELDESLGTFLCALERFQGMLAQAIDDNPSFADHLFRTATEHLLLQTLAETDSPMFAALDAVFQAVCSAQDSFASAPDCCFTQSLAPLLVHLSQEIDAATDQAKAIAEKTGASFTEPELRAPPSSLEVFWSRLQEALGGLSQTATCIATLHEQNAYEVDFALLLVAFENVAKHLMASAKQVYSVVTPLRPLCAARRTDPQTPLLIAAATLDDMARKLLNLSQKQTDHCRIFLEKEEFLCHLLTQACTLQETVFEAFDSRIQRIATFNYVEPENEHLLTALVELEASAGEIVAQNLEALTAEISAAETPVEGYLSACNSSLCVPYLEAMARGVQDFVEAAQGMCARHGIRLRLTGFSKTDNLECDDRAFLTQTLVQRFADLNTQWQTFASPWKKVTLLHHRRVFDEAVSALRNVFIRIKTAWDAWQIEASNVCLDCTGVFDQALLSTSEGTPAAFDAIRVHAQALCPSVFQTALDRIGSEVAVMAVALSRAAARFEDGALEDPLGISDPLSDLMTGFQSLSGSVTVLNERLGALDIPKDACIAETLNAWGQALAQDVSHVRTQVTQIASIARTSVPAAEGMFSALGENVTLLAGSWERLCNTLGQNVPDPRRPGLAHSLVGLGTSLKELAQRVERVKETVKKASFCNGQTLVSCGDVPVGTIQAIQIMQAATDELIRRLAAQNCCDAYAACLYQVGQNVRQVTLFLEGGAQETAASTLVPVLSPALSEVAAALKNLRERLATLESVAPLCVFEECAEEFRSLARCCAQLPTQLGSTIRFPEWDAFSFEGRNDCDYVRDLYRGLQARVQTFLRSFLEHLSIEGTSEGTLDDLESAFGSCAQGLGTVVSTLAHLKACGVTSCTACSLTLGETANRVEQIGALFQLARESLIEMRRFQQAQTAQAENERVAIMTNARLGATEEELALRPIVLLAERPRETVHALERRLIQAEQQAAYLRRQI